jgi:uncharacterized protein (DUF433 family)
MTSKDQPPRIDLYGGQEPSLVPLCTLRECADWLGLPQSTVRAWFFGQRGFESVLQPADRANKMLSFVNLTEVFVLAAVRRKHGVPLPQVREAVRYLSERFKDPHPLARHEMLTEGSALLIEHLGQLVSASEHGQLVSEELVRLHLERIERSSAGVPLRLYPFTRPIREDKIASAQGAPTSVVIDPRVQFGRPCLSGTGVPTSTIHERWLAGEDIQEIATDYGSMLADVQEALRFEDRRAA